MKHSDNDTDLVQSKRDQIQQQKNQWKYGLNYTFETLRGHKDWLGRNQQFVQFRQDFENLEQHTQALHQSLACCIHDSTRMSGLRQAKLAGRGPVYRVYMILCQIIANLSKSLEIMETPRSGGEQQNLVTFSLYCDTFVMDVTVQLDTDEERNEVKNVTLESTSIMTIVAESSTQYPDRDLDCFRLVKAALFHLENEDLSVRNTLDSEGLILMNVHRYSSSIFKF